MISNRLLDNFLHTESDLFFLLRNPSHSSEDEYFSMFSCEYLLILQLSSSFLQYTQESSSHDSITGDLAEF